MHCYKYPRAALTTDAIVYTKEKHQIYVLLIQRGSEPFKQKWALPGGFIEMHETLETACMRELEEETGLKLEKMQQYKSYDAPDRDPRHRTISVVYFAPIPQRQNVKGADDAAEARWFPVDELPELAFDHKKILTEFFDI